MTDAPAGGRGARGGPGGVDPVTLEVVNNRLDEAVREMQHVMFRTGYSTIIRDSKDGSAGICLPDGRVVGQAFRLPLHCGNFPPTVAAIYDRYDPDEVEPGDTFVTNDPYRSGANHAPDLVVATPAFHEGDLQAFCLTIAHKPDLGGIAPGSMSADAREIYHEGLLLPPVKYRRRGAVAPEVEAVIRNNSRTPEVTMGDVRGQVGSTNVGIAKLRSLFDDYGVETVRRAAEEILAATERTVGEAVEPWDGEVAVEGSLDNDVTSDDPITIRLTVSTVEGDGTLRFDFEGTDAQSDGPSNLQPHVAESACLNGVVGVIDPDLPLNSGVAAACDFRFPPGSVVHPTRPAPCGNYAKGMCVVTHLALRALSGFAPDLGVAETGNKASFTATYGAGEGDDPEDHDADEVVHFEILGSGYGGNRAADGASCMATSYESNVRFTPIEILETEYPVRVRRFDPRPDSAGPGAQRGGLGFVREYEPLTGAGVSYSGSNHDTRPKGVAGGEDAPTGRCLLNPGAREARALDTIERVEVAAGDRLRIERPGGGGYGDPLERSPERVLADVRDGFVSVEAAREAYGVVVERDDDRALTVDEAATRERRHSR